MKDIAVQIATQWMEEDDACFKRIETELIDIITANNYNNIAIFKRLYAMNSND